MKSILFDVDGVFLSEERCFDVSALIVEELLKSDDFLGLDSAQNFNYMNDELIEDIRTRVFLNDQILNQLKSLGLNSNWDMLFVVFSIHFIHLLKQLDSETIRQVTHVETFSVETLRELQSYNDQFKVNYAVPLKFIQNSQSGKENIYLELEGYAKDQLNIENAKLFNLKSPLWNLARAVYQEWYLGTTLYEKVEKLTPLSIPKSGFIYEEMILRPVEEIKTLLNDIKQAGFNIAIATGRPRTETIVPFESFGLKTFFNEKHIVTASEVLKAESVFPKEGSLGKPNPFSYIATLYGNNERDYLHYIQNQTHIVNEDDVFIVGDSLADLLCAKTIGATFIGTLTGLSGKGAKEELEQHGADYIVNHICDIRHILLNK